MRHWKGWDAVNFLNQSKHAPSWCETKGTAEPKSSPPVTPGCGWWIQISTMQNHSLYIWWENGRFEMLWIAQISPNSLNLGVKSGHEPSQLWSQLWLIHTFFVVVTIIEHIYQSQPSQTVHYTYDETLEGLRCCETLESIQTCSILVWNKGYCGAEIITTRDPKARE